MTRRGRNLEDHLAAGRTLNLGELVAGTFTHEAAHDTDKKFIRLLRRRREDPTHVMDPKQNALDAHVRVDKIHEQVNKEIGESNQ